MTPPRRRRRRRWLLVVLLLIAAAGAAEIALHLRPGLLPRWYREQFPVKGIEFVHHDILSRTPIQGYPVPGPQGSYTGPPPAGLVAPTPLVDPTANPDPERFPRVVLQVDERGFPNPSRPHHADVIFVGDSFTLAAASLEPPGLQRLLSEATGLSIYSLGIPGIGPIRQHWLLRYHGLTLKPRAVVWFFFGGNDLMDASKTQERIDSGAKTYADNGGYEPTPTVRVLDLAVRAWDRMGAAPPKRERMSEGVRLAEGPDAGIDSWFSPYYLRLMLTDRPGWKNHPGREIAFQQLTEVAQMLEAQDIELLLVYIPTKAEVMLPAVQDQVDRVWQMVTLNMKEESPITQAEFMETALRNRGALEGLVQLHCRREGIRFFTARPLLEQLTEEGRLGYLSADTHWNNVGQQVLVEPIREILDELGVEPADAGL